MSSRSHRGGKGICFCCEGQKKCIPRSAGNTTWGTSISIQTRWFALRMISAMKSKNVSSTIVMAGSEIVQRESLAVEAPKAQP
jgi:hypothetical protein